MSVLTNIDQNTKTFFLSRISSASLSTLFQALLASIFMALCSQIKILLPFTPIPLTLQTLAVIFIGATLGSRKGFYALLFYFSQIAMGMPVLSGGASDPLVFFGPKGGYVLGFAIQAFLMGWVVEKMPWSKSLTLLVGGLLSCLIQMILGVGVLAQFVGWTHVWMLGFYPFIPGEILKVVILCFACSQLAKSSFEVPNSINPNI